MPAEGGDALIDRLSRDLVPVRPRTTARTLLLLAVLGIVEVALYLAIRGMRPDMPAAMTQPMFWWKGASLLALAVIGGATALRAFDPAASPRRGLRRFAAAAAIALAAGWIIDAAGGGGAALRVRLAPADGLACVGAVVVLSLPALFAFGLLMRRGAATDPGGTAAAVGLTASAWGGLVFVVACPHDDPLYVALWFTVAITLVAFIARLTLPRLTRW